MDIEIPGLSELVNSTQSLVKETKREVQQIELDKERTALVNRAANQILTQLKPQLQLIEDEIKKLDIKGITGEPRDKLLNQKKTLKAAIKTAREKAEEAVDAYIYKKEAALLKEQILADQKEEALQFKKEILEELAELEGFFDVINYARDVIRPNASALRIIDGFNEVVEALTLIINKYVRGNPIENRVPNRTLDHICDNFIKDDRDYSRPSQWRNETKATQRTVTVSSDPATKYANLEGVVTVLGGHETLRDNVVTQLRRSKVKIQWWLVQDKVTEATRTQAAESDLIVLIAAHCSKEAAVAAREISKDKKVPLAEINSRGMSRVLDAIDSALSIKQLIAG